MRYSVRSLRGGKREKGKTREKENHSSARQRGTLVPLHLLRLTDFHPVFKPL